MTVTVSAEGPPPSTPAVVVQDFKPPVISKPPVVGMENGKVLPEFTSAVSFSHSFVAIF